MIWKVAITALVILVTVTVATSAQTPFTPPTQTYAATTSSGGTASALPVPTTGGPLPFALLQNLGAVPISYALSSQNTITVTPGGTIPTVQPGSCQLVFVGNQPGYVAVATGSSSANLEVTLQYQGPLPASCPGSAGGGTVTLGPGSSVIGKVDTDLTTPGTTNLVSAGFSQQASDTPTVQTAAYASGNCIGGFRSVTVTANNGQSGFITNFRVESIGGATPSVTVYLFDSNPSSSTCTDKSTFTLNSADVDKLLNNPATGAITLAAPIGTTTTFANVDFNPPRPFIAGGSAASGVKTIYYALVSGSAFTPGTATDIHTRIGASLN